VSSAYTQAVEGSYRLLSSLTGFNAWKHFQELERNQWLSYDSLSEIRWKKLKHLLDYAYENIPFYRSFWKRYGVDPRKFKSISDFVNLPVCSKKDLIPAQEEDQFQLSRKRNFEMVHTSGTTGAHFYVPFSRDDFQIKYAAYLRQFYVTGWRLGMKSAALHYSGHPQFGGQYTGREDRDTFVTIRRLAFRWAHRRILLTPYFESASGNDRFAAKWYESLRKFRPYLLETMQYNLSILNDYIKSNHLPPLTIPKTIVLGTYSEDLKRRLQDDFQTEIFDRYGPHEMEGVAYACPVHKGLHMAIDCVHTEFLDDNNKPLEPEHMGHIVLTDLNSRLMPLIRYRIGDQGFYYDSPCNCGRGLPLMSEISGRTQDLFELKNGKIVNPSDVTAIIQGEPSIRLFQIFQDKANQIIACIIPEPGSYHEGVAEQIRGKLYRLLGSDEQISVRVVDHVKLEPNGKYCYIKRSD